MGSCKVGERRQQVLRAEELKYKVEKHLEEAKEDFHKARESGKYHEAQFRAGQANAFAAMNYWLTQEIKNSPLK